MIFLKVLTKHGLKGIMKPLNLKSYIAEDAYMRFDDGTQVKGPKGFIKKIEKQYKEIEKTYGWGWETISAFSVKAVGAKDSSVRNQLGEWINAQFRGKRRINYNGMVSNS